MLNRKPRSSRVRAPLPRPGGPQRYRASSAHGMRPPIPTCIVPSAEPASRSAREIAREFVARIESGLPLRPAGAARRDPSRLLSRRYLPRHRLELFDTTFYLSGVRQNYYLKFFVAFVVQDGGRSAERGAYPRIFYKDGSLIWRSASHLGRQDGQFWVGKGDVATVADGDGELTYSRESTTDLPIEIQVAVEDLSRRDGRVPVDEGAMELVLRRAPDGRIEPYRDFLEPRRRAASNPRNLVNGGRPIARLRRRGDPGSLRFVPGFEPDLDAGPLETSAFASRLYHGAVTRYRILSRNRRIQYFFFSAPRHAWIIPPQATTTELSSFGVRTVDVEVDEGLVVPGYEYHFLDDSLDPPVLYSQIPEGFVGPGSESDDTRADASPWLDRLPIIQEFRRRILRRA